MRFSYSCVCVICLLPAAVSHEKGKITVLQLSALLKQADSSKRKLTLTRLASAPIPFTVLSITGNQWNEDFLAVCGLKVSVLPNPLECKICTQIWDFTERTLWIRMEE